MTREEMKFQVAVSCIQGILEAKYGILGEIAPEVAVKESFRIADEFVKLWFSEHLEEPAQPHWKPSEEQMNALLWATQFGVVQCPSAVSPKFLTELYNDLKKLK